MWLLVPTVLALSLALPPFALSLGRGVPSLPPLACAGRRSPPQLTLDGETGVVTSVHTGSELHELNGRPLVQLTHDEWRALLERGMVAGGAMAAVSELARAALAASGSDVASHFEAASHEAASGDTLEVIGALDDANQPAKMVEIYALGVEDKVFSHWHAGEPFSLDLHKFSQATAVSAVRYVLQHELGNYLPADLKIITGWGQHTPEGATPTLLPRIERLLSAELSPPLPYEKQTRLDCDRSGCRVVDNDGCLVVPVQELFKWLVDSRPFETYCINVPRST